MNFHGINGKIVSRAEAVLHLSDIGFRRSYAAFDYLRVINGRPLFMEDHLDRFENSARILGLELQLNRDDFQAHLLELADLNVAAEAGLQLFLTGGPAEDGFTPVSPQLYVYFTPMPDRDPTQYQQGAKLITWQYSRDLPEAKTTNYLMAVHLGNSMREAGAVDALYHDGDRALEATRSNLFVVNENSKVVTPGQDILAGVTRKNVLRVLESQIEVEIRDVTLTELYGAQEVFLTSTTKGALPIVRLDDRIVGNGQPGPITAQVAKLFESWLQRYLQS